MVNKGSFRALLRFRVASGDVTLGSHLHRAAGNACYISKTTQNQLLACIKDDILAMIVADIKAQEGPLMFSVLADEVTDK